MFDVQGDVSEIAGDVVARGGLERLAVVEHFHPEFGVADGLDAAFQVGRLPFFEFGGALELGDEPGRSGGLSTSSGRRWVCDSRARIFSQPSGCWESK